MINQAIMINNMHNILIYPMQCGVHDTIINECPKFLPASPASPAKDNHALLGHDPNGCSPSITILLSLHGILSYFEATFPSLAEYKGVNIPKYQLTSESPL